jgi:hypothetical protein
VQAECSQKYALMLLSNLRITLATTTQFFEVSSPDKYPQHARSRARTGDDHDADSLLDDKCHALLGCAAPRSALRLLARNGTKHHRHVLKKSRTLFKAPPIVADLPFVGAPFYSEQIGP